MSSSSGDGAGLVFGLMALFYIVMFGVSLFVTVRIAQKAGFSGWWALAAFVPMVNLAVILAFALVEWPVERAAKAGAYGSGFTPRPAVQPVPRTSYDMPPPPPGYTGPPASGTRPDGPPAPPASAYYAPPTD